MVSLLHDSHADDVSTQPKLAADVVQCGISRTWSPLPTSTINQTIRLLGDVVAPFGGNDADGALNPFAIRHQHRHGWPRSAAITAAWHRPGRRTSCRRCESDGCRRVRSCAFRRNGERGCCRCGRRAAAGATGLLRDGQRTRWPAVGLPRPGAQSARQTPVVPARHLRVSCHVDARGC